MTNMQQKDYLVKATAAKGMVRALAARTTYLVEDARQRHKTYPTVTAALGRLLTAGTLVGALLKGKETVTLRVLADGPIGGIVVVGNASGEVKGYVNNPEIHIPLNSIDKFDVAMAVGQTGTFYVSYDYELTEPYTGSVPIVSGELARDLAHYFAKSEQIPSVVALGVLVGWDGVLASGGLLIQIINEESKESITRILEKNLKTLPEVSALIHKNRFSPEEILEAALLGLDLVIHEQTNLQFKCHCSKEKVENILAALPDKDIRHLIFNEGQAEAKCHFCNETHIVTKQTLEEILDLRKKPPSSVQNKSHNIIPINPNHKNNP